MNPEPIPALEIYREKARWYLGKFTNHYGTQFCNIEADYAALWQIIDTYDCKSVMEIGTWEGYAMLFMWLNPRIERAVAVDICREYPGGGHHSGLAREHYGRYFRETGVQLLVKNSNNLTVDREFDLVFVDGDHSREQAERDLATAKRAARKVVAFHDWNNGNPGVNEMILSAPYRFKLVSGTSVVFLVL